MKRALVPAAVVLAALALSFAFSPQSAAQPTPSAAAPASATTDPAKPEAPGAEFATRSWPNERSANPKPNEWAKGEAIEPTRKIGPAAARCRVRRVREWIKIRCKDLRISAYTLLGGHRSGVSYWIDPPDAKLARVPGDGELILPVRRGDRRVIQAFGFGEGYDGPFTVLPVLLVQEYWLEDQASPVLIINDALVEPVKTKSTSKRGKP